MNELTMHKGTDSARNETEVNHKQWLTISGLLLLVLVAIGLSLVMLLNGGIVNHVLTPFLQYTSLFTVLWNDKPLGAIQFMINQPLLAFTYKDPRSTLNLWTYDFDFITTMVYVVACLLAGRIVAQYWYARQRAVYLSPLLLGLAGLGLTALSITYMSVIEHCAGPTWVGFVSLYGMGLDEFGLYSAYQIVIASVGVVLLGLGIYQMRRRRNAATKPH